MFDITDAADCSSSESADIPVNIISETPVVVHKRYVSSAGRLDAPSCAKMPKIHNTRSRNNIFRRLSSSTERSASSSSLVSLLSSSSSTSSHQTMKYHQMLEVFDDSSSTRSGSTNTRNSSSDGRQSDYEELSSDNRLFTRRDIVTLCLDTEMKEVRVQLYDIMRIEKYRKLLAPTLVTSNKKKMKDCEVEKILQKREHRGQIHYLIKWKNWDVNHNSWEPSQNLDCDELIFKFEKEREELITQFKTKMKFDPQDFHVHIFLAQHYETNNKTIIDAINDATIAIAGDSTYTAIRYYLNQNKHDIGLEENIKEKILFMLLLELRCEQLKSLEEWQTKMNEITEGKPMIKVENLVDLQNLPRDFCYIDEYLSGPGVDIPDNPPIGCKCKGTCGTSKKSDCCFAQNNDIVKSLPYTSARRLRLKEGNPIYECNELCACDETCPNRVVQLGTEAQLCIFRTDNERGWGVRTLRAIKKGTFVIKYVGEVITTQEVKEKRGRDFKRTGCSYLFDLDYNRQPSPYTVDAITHGNVSHFINHSCDPNLAVWPVWINCLEPDLPNLALFATKDIKQNEELTFNYGNKKPRKNALKNGVVCKCGTAKCRKFVF
ncbi:histone-lysine N-methyltransferase SUV39H1 [Mycetomoellerius zeteki]|uniref:histone-lysine N-methyltransferase SUV39H1 n=1 Tax=Mycetomoellerius zeteki TaxID=64791 RepID=UPI00084E7B72|nr:PREDICTED: histone-lysine N-methyltransferase SUV39H1 [Trachymyrmex zeteki]